MKREKIIEICDKSIVPYNRWGNRDSPSAQSQVATVRAYLLAGCKFRIRTEKDFPDENCITDSYTIWIDVYHYNFEDGETWNTYYLPTEKRLKETDCIDWY